jgi:hypothetical protein
LELAVLGAKREGAVYSGPWQESQPVEQANRGTMEALCRDRSDVFFWPGGLAPSDEYFQAWIGHGRIDRERSS